ncbi:MAG: hypothetical protein ACXVAY_13945 [Mucilaginibacter sp.]
MKKIIIAAAVILTAGLLTVVNKDNTVSKTEKIAKISFSYNRSVLGTAD